MLPEEKEAIFREKLFNQHKDLNSKLIPKARQTHRER